MRTILKYPRTRHLEGSNLQPGDEGLGRVPLGLLAGTHVVVEEKIDGANAGISFDEDGRLFLQSRGHYLAGGPREKHFALFKTWAASHKDALSAILGRRYIMYGEWVYACHTVFYDHLPHYFLEFDIFDTETETFLDTPRRRALIDGGPVASVPVLWEGLADEMPAPSDLVAPSLFKSTAWQTGLATSAREAGIDVGRAQHETDRDDRAEGLYLKQERDGIVTDRFKWVRASFYTAVLDSGSHWLDRPILPNRLAPGVDLFEVRS